MNMLWWKIFRWWIRIGPSGKEHRQLLEALHEPLFISAVEYERQCARRGYPLRWPSVTDLQNPER